MRLDLREQGAEVTDADVAVHCVPVGCPQGTCWLWQDKVWTPIESRTPTGPADYVYLSFPRAL